ncbi:hypothetical protein O181_063284 [Austropuccinia psidii MF-1]|uniref:Uncharacterized protein n=1 Tax=Austropuccinia psidii MF-1 TaxID=1389203 RepID=A0A9Q3I2E8_9BASI|nr:hypothetical protein [Austropuccinia psidii MF-1]
MHRTKPTESPIPCMPCKQTPQKPAPGPSGPQCELTFPPFVEPSQHNEPPIPGPSQASEPHEDPLTPNPATPASITIIDNMPVGCPCSFPRDPFHFLPEHNHLLPSAPSSPQSHNDAWQEFMDLRLTLMITQAIVHKSIN